jgi:hypothetical protein
MAADFSLLWVGFAAAGFENRLNGFWRVASSDEVADGFCGLVSASGVAEPPVVGCSGVAGRGSVGACCAATARPSASDWVPDAVVIPVALAAGIAATAASGFAAVAVWFCGDSPNHGADLAAAFEGAAGEAGAGSMASGDCAVVWLSVESAARVVGDACGATFTAVGASAGMAGMAGMVGVVAAASGMVAVATADEDAAAGAITVAATDGATDAITGAATGGAVCELIPASRIVASRMVVSRNDAAMADSGPLAGTASSLAKLESMRTLAATALTALPPGGTVP